MTTPLTPQDIADHKRHWMGESRYETQIHSDYTRESRQWLKYHVPKHEYHVQEHTNVYETTVIFEKSEHQILYQEWLQQNDS